MAYGTTYTPIKKPTKPFNVAIKGEAYQELINNTLTDKKVAQRFVAEISTLVSNNPKLQDCDPRTILSAGLVAQTMNLPLAPTLGFAYIIPYLNTKKDKDGNEYKVYEATFQAGWKAWVQMAIRTNQYERIGVRPVHKGEVYGQDEFGDDIIKFDHKYDDKEIVGYFAYMKLISGFSKTLYWTKEQCEAHGKKYSPEYNKYGTGKWKDMFDEMALKTVIKQLISKYGFVSTELETAIQADQAVVREDGKYDYVENQPIEEAPVKKTQITNTIELPKADDDLPFNG